MCYNTVSQHIVLLNENIVMYDTYQYVLLKVPNCIYSIAIEIIVFR